MRCQQKTAHWATPLASENQFYGSSNELRGLSSRQHPHLHSISVLSCQHINENVYSQNTAKQVTICCDLSCYQVLHCVFPPSFVLLGAIAKSMCLGKLSHSSSLSRQAKTVIFISKNTIITKSPIFHFAPMWTYNIPDCPKKEQNYCHLVCHNHVYPSRWLLLTTNCHLGPRCT